jgi:signal transducing adaptor molecule
MDIDNLTKDNIDQPYPQQPSSPDYGPQRNGPAPFYVVAGQQPPQAAPSQQYPQRDPTPRIPSNSKPAPLQTSSPQPQYPLHTSSPPPNQYAAPPAQTGHRPQSTYSNPQELATTAYDSPVNQQPNSAYSASVYSQDDAYASAAPINQQPPPSQQHYNAYVPPQQSQQQPGYEPPPPPGASHIPPPVQMNAGYPVIGDARQTLPSQGPPGKYKAYQRPGTSEEHNPSAPSAPPGGPQDFYRQSAAY